MNRCPSCGLEFALGARFCPKDGSRLDASAPPPAKDPLIGRTLHGRYVIQAKLGEGGMGVVYRAHHQGMDKTLAVKVLCSAMSGDELAARRFQREAKSASRLDHEHCIRVTDFGKTDDGLLYLAMEHLDGHTLARELYEKGALPAARTVAIAKQVCLALAHAHELAVVHRDLKPDNVFLLPRGGQIDFVKVLDFGLAKLLEREPDPDGNLPSVSTLTEAGTVFGTPEYMSPEQAEGKALSARTDIYSLGIVIYQMLTGVLPFQAPSFVGILSKHVTENPVAPCDRRPDLGIPRSLSDLVVRCLAKDPSSRPGSANAVWQDLDGAALTPTPTRVPRDLALQATLDLPVHPPVVSQPLPGSPTPHRRRLGLGVGFVLVLVAFGLIASRRPPPRVHVVPKVALPLAVTTPGPDAKPVLPAALPVLDPAPAAPATLPDHRMAENLHLADKYRQKGNRIKELFHLQQAVALDPENSFALYALGAALVAYGQDMRGCEYLRRAFKLKRAKALYEKSSCGLVEPD